MDLCRTAVAACDERSAVSVAAGADDSACDKDDKPPASRSASRYCSPRNFADFAERLVSLPAEVLENYLHRWKRSRVVYIILSRRHPNWRDYFCLASLFATFACQCHVKSCQVSQNTI